MSLDRPITPPTVWKSVTGCLRITLNLIGFDLDISIGREFRAHPFEHIFPSVV